MIKEAKASMQARAKSWESWLQQADFVEFQFCSVALSTLVLSYATFYCTDVLQLSPALVGTRCLWSAKCLISVTDVLAGLLWTADTLGQGRARYMLFLWFSTWLLFSCQKLALPPRPSASGFSACAKKFGIARMSISLSWLAVGFACSHSLQAAIWRFILRQVFFAAAGSIIPINMMQYLS